MDAGRNGGRLGARARWRRCGDQPRRRGPRREAVDRVAEARAGREPRPGNPQPRARQLRQPCAPPAVFLSSSAVGYYGARGDELVTESDAAGSDFLARLVVQWEDEATAAASNGTRGRAAAKRHRARTGRRRAGSHAAAVPARRRRTVRRAAASTCPGFTGRTGSASRDGCSPATTRVARSTRRRPRRRPTRSSRRPSRACCAAHTSCAPRRFALRLALGEMADAALLTGQRVVPARAQALGFRFQWPALEPALRDLLRR